MGKNQMEKFRVTVIARGEVLAAVSDGTEAGTYFKGDEGLLNIARSSISDARSVDITHSRFRDKVIASYDSPLGITAALCSVDEARSVIWKCPDEVSLFIKQAGEGCSRIQIKDEAGEG